MCALFFAPVLVESKQTARRGALSFPSGRGAEVLPEKPYNVFVVDDDESIRKALKRLLQVHGYFVITFESAEALLRSDWLHMEGCILLDIRLPGMSGPELYEKLASIKMIHPVIFMTAHDNPQWREWVAKTDAVAYLLKPFDQESVLDAVNLAARGRAGFQHETRN